jgi:DNA-binding transcriptional ArsR family regulator
MVDPSIQELLNLWIGAGMLSISSITLELYLPNGYVVGMAKVIFHPTTDQIELTTVLEALSDPIRREIVLGLSEDGEQNCSAFTDLSAKSNLTYHYVRLREAGLTRTRIAGAHRLITLRIDDIESRFPGLLTAVLAGARAERDQRVLQAARAGAG